MGFNPIFPTTKGILRKLGGDDNAYTIKWTYRENTDGFVVVEGALIKVSSLTPSIEELEGGTLSVSGAVNEKVTLTAYGESTTLMDIGGAIMATDLTMIVYSDNFVLEGLAFPEKGIYVPNNEAFATIEISYGSIHSIDPKFLPNDTLDLDEFGVGKEINEIISEGGGSRDVYISDNGEAAKNIAKLNPNYVTLLFDGMPVTCAIATKVVDLTGAVSLSTFGFKAFLLIGGVLAEVTIVVDCYIYQSPAGSNTRFSIYGQL